MTMMRDGKELDADRFLDELVQARAIWEGAVSALLDGDSAELKVKLEGAHAISRVLLSELAAEEGTRTEEFVITDTWTLGAGQ